MREFKKVENIFTGATWSNNHDQITLTVKPTGAIYGSGNKIDFELPTAMDARDYLVKLGYHFIGVN